MDLSVYPGTLSGTPLQLGRDLVTDFNQFDHYLFFRGGEYDYYCIIGSNIVQDGLSYIYTDCTLININYSHIDDMQMYYSMRNFDNVSGTVNNNLSCVCYTDISDCLPNLVDRGDLIVQMSILLSVGVCFFVYILDNIARCILRR